MERFTGLNFCSFEEYHEMNIYKLCIMMLFKYFKRKALQSFHENFIGFESAAQHVYGTVEHFFKCQNFVF